MCGRTEALKQRGCHACDHIGCWSGSRTCLFFRRRRVAHRDAQQGDTVPHLSQIQMTLRADEHEVPNNCGRLRSFWWVLARSLEYKVTVEFEDRLYFMGDASGDGCNCLIDTFRQRLGIICNVAAVRARLEQKHRELPTRIRPRGLFGPCRDVAGCHRGAGTV